MPSAVAYALLSSEVALTSPAAGEVWASVTSGTFHTCGTTVDATQATRSYCWGDNGFAELGTVDALPGDYSLDPYPIDGGANFTSVAAADAHSCALNTTGVAYCWGHVLASGHGLGSDVSTVADGFGNVYAPTKIAPDAMMTDYQFTSIGAGVGFSCGLTATGTLYCWGNYNPTTFDITTLVPARSVSPVAVTGVWNQVAVGPSHVCALDSAGELSCWGNNDLGQLGTIPPGGDAGAARVASRSYTYDNSGAQISH
jgi:alpha-tubulin suppressor-like RCC1 family protein